MTFLQLLYLVPIAYLLGSIPFGLIVGKTKGVDPRTAGSGNIGATNVGRLLGRQYFWIVFLLDLVKGLIPIAIGSWLLHQGNITPATLIAWLCIGAGSIVGHMFSLFLGFKGGKGVATGAGVALGAFPYYTLPAIIGLSLFALIFKITRIVSLSSILAAGSLPITFVLIGLARGWKVFGTLSPLTIFITVLASLIIYRHRANIARLRAGTEPRAARRAA